MDFETKSEVLFVNVFENQLFYKYRMEERAVMEVALFYTKDNESYVTWLDKHDSESGAGLLCQQHPAWFCWICFPACKSLPLYGMFLGFSTWLIKKIPPHLNCQVCVHLGWEVEACQSGTPLPSSLIPCLCSLFVFRELVLELGWCNSSC